MLAGLVSAHREQHDISSLTFDQGSNRRLSKRSNDEVAFPMSRDSTIFNLSRAVRNEDHVLDVSARIFASLRFAAGPFRTQASREFFSQCPS